MVIRHDISEEDQVRSLNVQATPTMLAKSFYCGIEAGDVFARKFLNPVIATQVSLTEREATILGLYYRIIAYCRSLLALNDAIHFQSISSATRSIVELYLDIEILHRDLFSDGVRRIIAFTEAQKLDAARRTVNFFDANPTLACPDFLIAPQREFMKNEEARINAQTEKLWGLDRKNNPRKPDHWTNQNLKSRAAPLGIGYELLVNAEYDLRNFLIHTGLAGVSGLDSTNFTTICWLSYKAVHQCTLGTFKTVVDELKLKAVIEGFVRQMEDIRELPAWTLTDERLKSLGEPGRVTIEL